MPYEWRPHVNTRVLRAAFEERDWDWDSYRAFTTIRNPWARVVSMWHFGETHPASVWSKHRQATGTFKRFVLELPEYVERLYREEHAPTGMTNMSIDQFADETVRVFRLEDISVELPPYLAELGLPDVGPMPHINQTEHDDYRRYYDPESRKTVRRLMEADIEVGRYRFSDRQTGQPRAVEDQAEQSVPRR